MKKFVSLLLAMALVLSLCAFAQAEEITLRVLAGQSTTDAGIQADRSGIPQSLPRASRPYSTAL